MNIVTISVASWVFVAAAALFLPKEEKPFAVIFLVLNLVIHFAWQQGAKWQREDWSPLTQTKPTHQTP